QLETELECFTGCELLRAPEEFSARGIDTADVGWCRRASLFDVRATDGSEDHEELVAFDRVIAFEHVLVVRIPPAGPLERNVAAPRATIAVAIIFGKRDAPAIGRFPALRRDGLARRGWGEGNINRGVLIGFDDYVFELV